MLRDLLALELPADHPQLGVCELNVATAQRRAGVAGDDAGAAALRIFVVHFGKDHPHTLRVRQALVDLFGADKTDTWLAALGA